MTELRPSRREELPRQRALWKQAFGDGDAFLDFFYARCAGPEDVLVLLDGGTLCTMLVLLPVELTLPGGGAVSSAYVYALATDPAARGRGYGRALLRYTDFYLREHGVDSVTVVPAQPGLHRFFAGVDYREGFSLRETRLPRSAVGRPGPADVLAPVGPAEYAALREAYLAGTFHVTYGEKSLLCQQGLSQMTGGGLFRLTVGGVTGCAAAECGGDTAVVKELLLPPDRLPGAAALLAAALPAQQYVLRGPVPPAAGPDGQPLPFGMVKWLGRGEAPWQGLSGGYMGLGFD